MKTRFSMAIACLMMAIMVGLTTTGARAQQTNPCSMNPPDCGSTPFVLQVSRNVTLPGGCIVTLSYSQRCACGVFNDFAMESITVPNNPACNALTIQQIVDQTAEAFIEQWFAANPPCPNVIIPPCGQGLNTNWRALVGSCVHEEVTVEGTRILRYCAGSSCCWQTFGVCQRSDGTFDAIPGPKTPATPCTEPNCQPICPTN